MTTTIETELTDAMMRLDPRDWTTGQLVHAMMQLDVRERLVIKARLNGESYAAIGREHNVSGDTIRRIEAEAIRRLRWLLKAEEAKV